MSILKVIYLVPLFFSYSLFIGTENWDLSEILFGQKISKISFCEIDIYNFPIYYFYIDILKRENKIIHICTTLAHFFALEWSLILSMKQKCNDTIWSIWWNYGSFSSKPPIIYGIEYHVSSYAEWIEHNPCTVIQTPFKT